MATQRPGFAVSYPELAAALLSSSEVAPRARLIAQQVAGMFPDSAVVVYLFDGQQWQPRATEGEVAFAEPAIAADFGTLGAILAKQDVVLFSGAELPREEYAHLNIRRTIVSLVGIPLFVDENLVGAIEVLSFRQAIAESSLAALSDFDKIAALGLAAGAAYENERNSQLESITRITQMYDLEKVFNSNLEMDDLVNMITSKFHEIMGVQAVNLWMVEGDSMVLTSQAGADSTCVVGTAQKPGDGVAGDVSENGEPVLIDDPSDERLIHRNEGIEEGAVLTLVAAPVMDRGSLVGVVEAVNRLDGTAFDEDELFLLTTMCETASNALHNASLLQAERKVEILETLVQVSQEITSTLNLDRVMQTVVNGPQAVIPYERAAIAVERNGKLQLGAVSGVLQIDRNDPSIRRLDQLLQWASVSKEEIWITQRDDEVDAEREETRAKFKEYFAETGGRGFYALPLTDDQGRVGILAFESSDPEFLSLAHLEMIKVLAGQATVALRNAQMYTEVPFIGVLEPLLQKKQKFLAMEKSRQKATLALGAALVLFLAVFPLPMRVEGTAAVAPARTAQIQPEIEGVVQRVLVREGDPVVKGTILAKLEDWDFRGAVSAAQAKRDEAMLKMNQALARNDGTEAGVQQVQLNFWTAELARAKERLEKTNLRSPIDGIVATPHVEDFVGKRLAYGDSFAEVVDTSRAVVDVAVDEKDVHLVQPGDRAAVKLEGFPTRTFRGDVLVVSPKSQLQADQRMFFARVSVPNPEGMIRAGMQGRSKISTGWHSAGFVLLRRPAMWAWEKVWSWFGW